MICSRDTIKSNPTRLAPAFSQKSVGAVAFLFLSLAAPPARSLSDTTKKKEEEVEDRRQRTPEVFRRTRPPTAWTRSFLRLHRQQSNERPHTPYTGYYVLYLVQLHTRTNYLLTTCMH